MAKPMKVVVDCGNGVAGVIAPQLIEALAAARDPAVLRGRRQLPRTTIRTRASRRT